MPEEKTQLVYKEWWSLNNCKDFAFFSLIASLILQLSTELHGAPHYTILTEEEISPRCSALSERENEIKGYLRDCSQYSSTAECHLCLNPCHRLLRLIKSCKTPCKYELTGSHEDHFYFYDDLPVKFSCSDMRNQLSLDNVSAQVVLVIQARSFMEKIWCYISHCSRVKCPEEEANETNVWEGQKEKHRKELKKGVLGGLWRVLDLALRVKFLALVLLRTCL